MGSVTRKTLLWPSRATDGTENSAGVPEAAAQGFVITSAASLVNSISYEGLAQNSYRRLDLPAARGGDGPVRAIAIAPDSVIHSCDIAFHGQDGEIERHRVAPGNPCLVQNTEADFAMVSIPNALPAFTSTANSNTAYADAVLNNFSSGHAATITPGWPLRLEVWRGDDLVHLRAVQRAKAVAHAFLTINNSGSGGGAASGSLMMCVDGRRNIRVMATTDNQPVACAIWAYDAFKRSTLPNYDLPVSTVLPLNAAGAVTLNTTTAAPLFVTYTGVPMTVIEIILSVAGATLNNCQIHVEAFD